MTRRLALAAVLAAAAGGGCLWTDFDELRDDVWVDSVGAIEGSTKFGEVVVEASAGAPPNGGALIAVIGRTAPSLSRLSYGADGSRDLLAAGLTETVPLLTVLEENPVYASDPASDQVAIAGLSGAPGATNRGLNIGVFSGFTSGRPSGLFYEPTGDPALGGPEEPTAMVFASSTELLVGRRGRLQRVDLGGTSGQFTQCILDTMPNETPFAIAIGDPDGDTNLDYVIASATDVSPQTRLPESGRIWTVPVNPGIFNGAQCPAAGREIASGGNNDFLMDFGTQIQIADLGAGPRVLVSTPGDNGKISVIDFTQGTPVATLLGTGQPDLDSFWVEDLGGAAGPEIIVGMPRADVEGTPNAGMVRILDVAGSVQAELYDANASDEQHFGKSVTVVPFGTTGRKVVVVGAEGEVFTYFRTTLYDEVRSNR